MYNKDKINKETLAKIKAIKNKIQNGEKIKNEEVFNIFEEIFNSNNIYKDTFIPLSFLTSDLGTILINALTKTNIDEYVSIQTAVKETGFSRQYIHKEITRGNLKAKKEGVWFIRRIDLEEYKNKKDINIES